MWAEAEGTFLHFWAWQRHVSVWGAQSEAPSPELRAKQVQVQAVVQEAVSAPVQDRVRVWGVSEESRLQAVSGRQDEVRRDQRSDAGEDKDKAGAEGSERRDSS